MSNNLKVGDKVEIIKYGHILWINTNEKFNANFPIIQQNSTTIWYDSQKELVGQVGTITSIIISQGILRFSLDGIKGKHAWYDKEQLELTTDLEKI